MSVDDAQRILARSIQQGECIVWNGAANGKGYGCIGINGKSQLTHRVVYQETVAPIRSDLTIDHTSRVRLCVNVDHMELVTRAENVRRALDHKTHCVRGHELTGDNIHVHERPGYVARRCKPCADEDKRNARTRKRLAQAA
jgi:hypothetical protein